MTLTKYKAAALASLGAGKMFGLMASGFLVAHIANGEFYFQTLFFGSLWGAGIVASIVFCILEFRRDKNSEANERAEYERLRKKFECMSNTSG